MRHIIPISGKDSLATALVQTAREPDLPYEFMFNPTGQEYPVVDEWLERVEKHFGKPIVRVGRSLKQIIAEQNFFLPSPQARYCTRLAKIQPMEKFLGKDDAFIYFGIRADEDRGGYDNSSTPNITPKYPLKEVGINLEMVFQIVTAKGLEPPAFIWTRLVEAVSKRIPQSFIDELPKPIYNAVFSWRSRMNCSNCFFQRQYEWLGLYEHYPELFWENEKLEHSVSEYYFLGKNKPLTWLIEHQDEIFKRRADEVVSILADLMQGRLGFAVDGADMLNVVSCGLWCAK